MKPALIPVAIDECPSASVKRIIASSAGLVTAHTADVVRLQALADEHLADARGSLHDLADKLIDVELWPEDSEIVSEIRHMFMREWGMDEQQADARMGRFDYSAAVAAITGEEA